MEPIINFKLFTKENGEQLLYERMYCPIDEEYQVSMITHSALLGARVQQVVSFASQDDRDRAFDEVNELNAEKIFKTGRP